MPEASAGYRPAVVRASNPAAKTPSACPEIDCVRDLLPARVIAAAEQRALSIGLGADRVLICADVMTEEGYLTALATSLGTFFDPLEDVSRADCPLSDDQLIQAAANGLLPLLDGDELCWIIAPRCLTARNLAKLGRFRFAMAAVIPIDVAGTAVPVCVTVCTGGARTTRRRRASALAAESFQRTAGRKFGLDCDSDNRRRCRRDLRCGSGRGNQRGRDVLLRGHFGCRGVAAS